MLKNTSAAHDAYKQKGAALLEALMGILVFSLGVMAIVGMQTVAVRSVTDSKHRAVATYLANQLVAEMWANRQFLNEYEWDGLTASPVIVPDRLEDWELRVRRSLPGTTNAYTTPTASVDVTTPTGTADTGTNIDITIAWQSPGEPEHRHRLVTTIAAGR